MGGYGAAMALRAFPVLYANDVESVAAFYVALGFEERVRMPDATGAAKQLTVEAVTE